MREEFLIDRGGKQFVLFAGLLDEAHRQGLREIDTELIQVPKEENNNVAICKARVVMDVLSEPDNPLRNSFGEPYSDGDHPRTVERAFSGIGDASPANVGRAIVPHIIRMAETRAKARALRDAVNVGVTALEELADEEPPTPNSASVEAIQGGDRLATEEQLEELAFLAEQQGFSDEDIEKALKVYGAKSYDTVERRIQRMRKARDSEAEAEATNDAF